MPCESNKNKCGTGTKVPVHLDTVNEIENDASSLNTINCSNQSEVGIFTFTRDINLVASDEEIVSPYLGLRITSMSGVTVSIYAELEFNLYEEITFRYFDGEGNLITDVVY